MTTGRRRIAVIGSNSFSGAHFVDLLLDDPQNHVLGISRSPEYHPCLLPYKRHQDAAFEFHQLDLVDQHDEVIALLDDREPEYIVNFAAQGEVSSSFEHPDHHFTTNALAIVRLTNVLRERDYLRRYVHISTPEVYGTIQEGMKESNIYDPSSPYAASKGAADLFLNAMHKTFGFPVVTIRATNVYGPHQQLYRIIPRTAICVKNGKTLMLHGGGKAVKSYIHIQDVSRGELLAMENGVDGETYHFSPNGDGISIHDVVAVVCNEMGTRFDDHVEMTADRLGQDKAYILNSEKARQSLGWAPGIDFQSGVRETVAWIEREWDAIKDLPQDYNHQK